MLELYKPHVSDLWFRKNILSDEQTMSYNHACGGAIRFSEERWVDWYDKWIENHNGERFYRYIRENNTYIGEVAYYFDVERKYTLQVLLFMLYIVEKDMDVKDLLLCEAAKKNGVQV